MVAPGHMPVSSKQGPATTMNVIYSFLKDQFRAIGDTRLLIGLVARVWVTEPLRFTSIW